MRLNILLIKTELVGKNKKAKKNYFHILYILFLNTILILKYNVVTSIKENYVRYKAYKIDIMYVAA